MSTGIQPDPTIIYSICNYQAALKQLIIEPGIQKVIDRISLKVAAEFHLDAAALATYLSSKLPIYLATIDTSKEDWEELLSRWCQTVTKHCALNILRHQNETEKKHEDIVTHLNSKGKRNSRPVLTSHVPTPEEELLNKEKEELWKARSNDIRDKVLRAIMEDVTIAGLWSKGYKGIEIAKILNKPKSTVQGKLKKIQKAVIAEIGIIPSEDNKALIKAGLRELIANSLSGVLSEHLYDPQSTVAPKGAD